MAQREDAVIVNALVRQALVSAEEVMGENGLHAVLRTSGLDRFINNLPPDNLDPGIPTREYARLNEAIEAFYGRGGRGMLRRIGKASFQYGIRDQGNLIGVKSIAIKLLPEKQRIKLVLSETANALKKTNPQVDAWIDDSNDKLAYVDATCGICHGRHSTTPICHLYIGSIGEAVQWATGREYDIIETHCFARGDEFCRFEVGEPRA